MSAWEAPTSTSARAIRVRDRQIHPGRALVYRHGAGWWQWMAWSRDRDRISGGEEATQREAFAVACAELHADRGLPMPGRVIT